MSYLHVNFKMPRARTESQFTIYPFTADDSQIKLQSDNHCIVVMVSGPLMGKSFLSKRFNQYPRFEYCQPQHGGKMVDTPETITAQLVPILAAPTGHVVTLGA